MGIYSNFGESATAVSSDLFNIDPTSDSIQESDLDIGLFGAFQLMAECDANYNAMMKAIGIHELSSIEENGEVLYEAADVRGFINRLKQFFVTLLQKIASVVKRFFAMVDSLTKNDAAFLKKYESALNKISADKLKDKEVKVFTFTNLNWNPKDFTDVSQKVNSIGDPTKVLSALDASQAEKLHSLAKSLGEMDAEEYQAEVRGSMLDTNPIDSSDFSEEITKFFRNGETDRDTKNLTTAMIHDAVTAIRTTKDMKKAAQKNFDEFKKYIDKLCKTLDEAGRKIDKAKVPDDVTVNGPVYGDSVAVLNKFSSINKSVLGIGQTVFNGQMAALKDRNRQSRMVCTKALAAGNHVSMKKEGFEHFGGETGSFFDNIVMK